MRHILPITLILLMMSIFTLPVGAYDHSSQKENAKSGDSEVFGSIIGAAGKIDDSPKEGSSIPLADYQALIDKYENAMDRDPLADLVELFPVADIDDVRRYAEMDSSEILNILNGEVDEETMLGLIIARSPKLAAAESKWRASLERYPQALFLQDLLERYKSFSENMQLGIGKEFQRGMIQMNYPLQGMLSLKGRIAELDAETGYKEYLKTGRDVISDAKSLLAEIENNVELVSINQESVYRLSSLRNVVKAQYVAGSRSFSDLIRIETETDRRRDMLSRMQAMGEGLTAKLAAMMDMPSHALPETITWIDNIYPIPNRESFVEEIHFSRQELAVLGLTIEKMDAMIEMTGIRAIPDLTMGTTYFQGRQSVGTGSRGSAMDTGGMEMDSEVDMGGMDMGAGMDMGSGMDMDTGMEMDMDMGSMNFMSGPMIDFRKSNYAIDAAWLMELIERREAMSHMLIGKIDMALGMLDMLLAKYDQRLESETRYAGSIVPDARIALEAVKRGYIVDENSFNDLISSELALLMARMDLANTRMELEKTKIEIERLVGRMWS